MAERRSCPLCTMGVQQTVNLSPSGRVGSIPTVGTRYWMGSPSHVARCSQYHIGLSSNGRTEAFGTSDDGSNPSGPTLGLQTCVIPQSSG